VWRATDAQVYVVTVVNMVEVDTWG
jgi:hypothetical protein